MGKKSRKRNKKTTTKMSVTSDTNTTNTNEDTVNVNVNGSVDAAPMTTEGAQLDKNPDNAKDEVVSPDSQSAAEVEDVAPTPPVAEEAPNTDEANTTEEESEQVPVVEEQKQEPVVEDSAPSSGYISEIESDAEEEADEGDNYFTAVPEPEPTVETDNDEAECEPSKEDVPVPTTLAEAVAEAEEDTAAANGPRPIVIAGPSGTGKGTLISILMDRYPNKQFGFSVSHTTRQPREGEVNSIHYNFTSVDSMKGEIDAGKFIEYAEVHGNYYGTSVEAVQSVTKMGQVCILDIDVQGVRLVKESKLDPYYVFIAPPSMEHLEKRLRGRGTEKEEDIQKRLANAKGEMDYGQVEGNFDKYLVNDDLDVASEDLCATVEAWFPHLKRVDDAAAAAVDEEEAEEDWDKIYTPGEAETSGDESEMPEDEADPKLSETETEVVDNTAGNGERSLEYPEDEFEFEASEAASEAEAETETEVKEEEPVGDDIEDTLEEVNEVSGGSEKDAEASAEIEAEASVAINNGTEDYPDDEVEKSVVETEGVSIEPAVEEATNEEEEEVPESAEEVEEITNDDEEEVLEETNEVPKSSVEIEKSAVETETVLDSPVAVEATNDDEVEVPEVKIEVPESAEEVVPEPALEEENPKQEAEVKRAPQDKLETEEVPATKTATREDVKEPATEAKVEIANPSGVYYTLEELKFPIDGVEWAQRQDYLSDDDAQKHFGMTLSEFNALPKWKKQATKKKLGIF